MDRSQAIAAMAEELCSGVRRSVEAECGLACDVVMVIRMQGEEVECTIGASTIAHDEPSGRKAVTKALELAYQRVLSTRPDHGQQR